MKAHYPGRNLLLTLSILLLTSCSQEKRDFVRLKALRKSTAESEVIARQLKETPKGIELALEDINCFGGETRGWSSWMIEGSSVPEIDLKLRKILSGEKSLPRRIEAARLLWLRTNESEWLLEWYKLVEKAGPPAIGVGRRLLISAYDCGEEAARINVPADVDVTLSSEEFRDLIDGGAK